MKCFIVLRQQQKVQQKCDEYERTIRDLHVQSKKAEEYEKRMNDLEVEAKRGSKQFALVNESTFRRFLISCGHGAYIWDQPERIQLVFDV